MKKVSVVIPTFNRFSYLLNTIHSIKSQTYQDIEIIVVNDCSTQKEYYEYDYTKHDIIILHLEENTKTIFGFACAAHVRNKGIEISTGKYVAFCDDDDIWFPEKITLQLSAMKQSGCKMSSTDGLIGYGVYDIHCKYKILLAEYYFDALQNIYRSKGSNLLENGFPAIWTRDFLNVHNCIICSSVIIEKEILDIIQNFSCIKPPGEDYDCWLKALQHTDCVYIQDTCVYYDFGHGDGQLY